MKLLFGAAALAVALGLGVASFFAIRALVDNDPPATAEPLDQDWWSTAFAEDLTKPRLQKGVINGILVGPELALAPSSGLCQEMGVEPLYIPVDKIDARSSGTPLEVSPSYLPDGVFPSGGEGSECGRTLVAVAKYFDVPGKENPADKRFPLWAGGSFSISRRLSTSPQYVLDGAAERVAAFEIGGRPAVIVRPIAPLGVDAGIGSGAIVIADGSVVTAIEGSGLPFDEFIKVAESLYGGLQ